MVKAIALIWPLAERSREECDEHYRLVHVPMMRRQTRAGEGWVSYAQDLFTRQYDVNGTFEAAPDRWRMVVLRYTAQAERDGANTAPYLAGFLELDHPNFLGRMRRFDVREEVVRDSLSRQTALCKYVVVVESTDAGTLGRQHAEATISRIGDLAVREAAGALRLAYDNRVVAESVIRPLGETSEIGTGERRVGSDVVSILELWFDNTLDARSVFSCDDMRRVLLEPHVRVSAYEASESCSFDLRS